MPETPFCEAGFARKCKVFSGAREVYTEDVGGSSPSSPTIKTSSYHEITKCAAGSMNLFPTLPRLMNSQSRHHINPCPCM